MPQCVVCGYHSSNGSKRVKNNIMFHKFPLDPKLREKWVQAITREKWCPAPYNVICSLHFKAEDYDRTSPFRTYLKKGVVPSIFSGINLVAMRKFISRKYKLRTSTTKNHRKTMESDVTTQTKSPHEAMESDVNSETEDYESDTLNNDANDSNSLQTMKDEIALPFKQEYIEEFRPDDSKILSLERLKSETEDELDTLASLDDKKNRISLETDCQIKVENLEVQDLEENDVKLHNDEPYNTKVNNEGEHDEEVQETDCEIKVENLEVQDLEESDVKLHNDELYNTKVTNGGEHDEEVKDAEFWYIEVQNMESHNSLLENEDKSLINIQEEKRFRGRTCIVKNCISNTLDPKNRGKVFMLPKNYVRRMQWLDILDRSDLREFRYGQVPISNAFGVCHLHFSDHHFTTVSKLTLNYNASPNRVLQEDILGI